MIDGFVWTPAPGHMFPEHWKGWGDFTGSGNWKSSHRSPEEWLLFAESLAQEHDGVLPCKKWITEHGYHGLVAAISQHPDLFAHIPQTRLVKSPEEWVSIAQELADRHGGVLPCKNWLCKNGHKGLCSAIRKHPELFSHIDQEKPHDHRKTLEEAIIEAESLAAKNKGVLQDSGWLRDNGYVWVKRAIVKHPSRFSHIPQIKMRRRLPVRKLTSTARFNPSKEQLHEQRQDDHSDRDQD
jgi:hypothetical protein